MNRAEIKAEAVRLSDKYCHESKHGADVCAISWEIEATLLAVARRVLEEDAKIALVACGRRHDCVKKIRRKLKEMGK